MPPWTGGPLYAARCWAMTPRACARGSLGGWGSARGSARAEAPAADSGRAALELAGKERFDAVLLDIGLPDMDGREVCRQLRRARVSSPIIMLTAADSDSDTILGLESGANDYVAKPFRMGVLLARLRAQLRLHAQSEDAVFVIGPYTFRPSAKLLVDEAKRRKIRLTEK